MTNGVCNAFELDWLYKIKFNHVLIYDFLQKKKKTMRCFALFINSFFFVKKAVNVDFFYNST